MLISIYIAYFPFYITIFIGTFWYWCIKYLWVRKIKKYTFAITYDIFISESNLWYDHGIYFLFMTPIYFATKAFKKLWTKQLKFSFKNSIKLIPFILISIITQVPLSVIIVVTYWYALVNSYLLDKNNFFNNYYTIHSYFFLKK